MTLPASMTPPMTATGAPALAANFPADAPFRAACLPKSAIRAIRPPFPGSLGVLTGAPGFPEAAPPLPPACPEPPFTRSESAPSVRDIRSLTMYTGRGRGSRPSPIPLTALPRTPPPSLPSVFPPSFRAPKPPSAARLPPTSSSFPPICWVSRIYLMPSSMTSLMGWANASAAFPSSAFRRAV